MCLSPNLPSLPQPVTPPPPPPSPGEDVTQRQTSVRRNRAVNPVGLETLRRDLLIPVGQSSAQAGLNSLALR